MIRGWPIHGEREQEYISMAYQETYRSIRAHQPQAVAGRWRSLAREHLRRCTTEEKAEIDHWMASTQMAIQSVCEATGCVDASGWQDIKCASHDALAAIVELALRLRNIIGEEVTSYDYYTLLYTSKNQADPQCMEQDRGEPLKRTDPSVLCTTELGLMRRERLGTTNSEPEFHTDIILKAKVALVSLLHSSEEQTHARRAERAREPRSGEHARHAARKDGSSGGKDRARMRQKRARD
ncbi:hypothetical protein OE88DRAFT_1660045 [Heliocybe sulcata]|uniref:Uncharacterized protein n=1 Tax=Heliocybe sulcata TaxID=5364 RepID=A0A5C3N1J7_9AGAM|nr:hypothetical protein OE88DRAFT_1660045 [Heliocybe sulcata]